MYLHLILHILKFENSKIHNKYLLLTMHIVKYLVINSLK